MNYFKLSRTTIFITGQITLKRTLFWNKFPFGVQHREKTYPSYEFPSLEGSVLQSSIIDSIRTKYYSTDDNIEKRLLNDGGTFALISTARKLSAFLDQNGIDYAIIGGFALNAHGFKRQTIDVDVLISRDNMEMFTKKIVYKGFVPRFTGARKSFRDPVSNVGVDIITSGQYPGDGKEKSIFFPDPTAVSVLVDGLKLVNLPTLINIKLASYKSMPIELMKDRTDVSGLVKMLSMDDSFAEQLHSDVADEFCRIVKEVAAELERKQ